MAHTPTTHDVTLSHLIDDAEKVRSAVLRDTRQIDRIIPDLRHAIEHGRTDAALDLLITIDRLNSAVITTATPTLTV
jgi:hypothetical protein